MEEQSVDEFHIRHLMLREFQKHNNATNATNAINAVYALDTRTCQRWFQKFKNRDFSLFDGIKSRRRTLLMGTLILKKSTVNTLYFVLRNKNILLHHCLH